MSYIGALEVCGIRAFSPDRGEVIRFSKPLTLIAGINGSGKTTIIETLRFATTGSLPPNAGKSGLWIHDPDLVSRTSVNAMARLKFYSADHAELVASRRLIMETKKTGSRSQKATECSLLLRKKGEKFTLSTRVAELDTLLPQYLGVSPSLLDNVIFCHQESSLWPLDESGVLKKKFDEIFEAGKYTNAVKELNAIRKKHRAEVGTQEALAGVAQKERDRARRAQQQMNELHADVETLRARHESLSASRNKATKEAQELYDQFVQYNQTLLNLESYRNQADVAEQALAELRSHLTEMQESDEWLKSALSRFDDTIQGYQDEKQSKTSQYHSQDEQLNGLKSELDECLTQRGQHEQERQTQNVRLERRKTRIRESATRHGIRGFNDLDDDNKIEEFLFKIKKISKDSTNKAKRSREEYDSSKQEAQVKINQLTARQSVLKDNRANVSKQAATNNREIGTRQTEANNVEVNEGDLAAHKTRISDINTKLNSSREALLSADYPAKIRKSDSDFVSLKADLKTSNDELFQSTTRVSEQAQLSHVKQELKEKEQSFRTLKTAHSARISSLLGESWTDDALERCFAAKLDDAAKQISLVEKERDTITREVEQVEYKQKTKKDSLKAAQKEAKESENAIVQIIDDDVSEYETCLRDVESRLEQAQEDIKEVGGLSAYFQKVLETAESKHACRVCDRSFKGPQDPLFTRFKSKLEGLLVKASAEQQEEALKEATEEHKRVREVGSKYVTWKRLREHDIPELERELSKLKSNHESLQSDIEKADMKVEEAATAHKSIETLSSTVSALVKIDQEIKALRSKADKLSVQQSQNGPIKSIEDIRENIDGLNARIQEHEKLRARLHEEQENAKSEIRDRELELSKLETELGSLSRRLDQKSALLDRIEEYKSQNSKHKEAMAKIDLELERLGPEIDAANVQYEDVVRRAETEINELAQHASDLMDTVNALDNISFEIEAYIEKGSEQNLARVVKKIDLLRQKIGGVEAAKLQLTKDIGKLDEQVRDSERTRRQYSDNIRYRKDLKHLDGLRKEIDELQAQDAQGDRAELKEKWEKRDRQAQNMSAQMEGIKGEMKSKDVMLTQLIEEYNTHLKDAASRYREAHVKAETTKAAIEDIGKYSKALDQAVTKYHSLKMEQVNSIIEDLWRQTYKGTDVDKIYIRSDFELKGNTGTRSHNYRVVMVKRGVELDMRGRCSAGQKVLACIIIRLALAECFSRNCGVIALDEPTTNLDAKNIAALATSLHDLIQHRQEQGNFQLIVITHDEAFLRQMQCDDFTDDYYRISRDTNDNSVIHKQSIGEVMGNRD